MGVDQALDHAGVGEAGEKCQDEEIFCESMRITSMKLSKVYGEIQVPCGRPV